MPTAAPWADVACRASPDGRPHRPQSKSGHRSRRSGKPTGSVCRSSPLPSCVLQLAPLSPAQAATTTRGRPQLRPQDWIRSQTPGSPPVRRSQTSAAATLRAVEQCRSSMVGSPGHQLADPDHQQWSPHNAQICGRWRARHRGGHRADRTPLCIEVKVECGRDDAWRACPFPLRSIIGSRVATSRTPCGRRCAAGLRPVLDPAASSYRMAAAREREQQGS